MKDKELRSPLRRVNSMRIAEWGKKIKKERALRNADCGMAERTLIRLRQSVGQENDGHKVRCNFARPGCNVLK